MTILYIILLIETIFCFVEYIHVNAVIVQPTFLAYCVLLVSTFFGILGNLYWKLEIAPITVAVVFLGMLAMFLADLAAKKFVRRKNYREQVSGKEIVIAGTKLYPMILIIVFLTLLYCYDIYRAGVNAGGRGLSAIFAAKTNAEETSVIIRQGVKLITATAFVHSYIFTNNVLYLKKKGMDNLLHLVPIVCSLICSLFTGIRTDMMRILTAIAVDYCVILYQNKVWKKRSAKIFIKKMLPVVVLAAFFMTAIRFVVKGTNNATSNTYGVLMYICYYLGSPIIVLSSKLNIGISTFRRSVWGEYSFIEIWKLLQKIGFIKNVDLTERSVNVWISRSDGITANVDTIFGAPMIDFGLAGMFVYIFILFYILNAFYYKNIHLSASGRLRDGKLIVYSNIAIISSMAYYGNLASLFGSLYYIFTVIASYILFIYYYNPQYRET